MRVLMVGPWWTVAMRRHIDWAAEAGIEVCVADFRPPSSVTLPATFQFANLTPRRIKASHQSPRHRKSRRAHEIAVLRLRECIARFQPHVVHSYKLNCHTDLCLSAGVQPLVVSAWGFLNALMSTGPASKERQWMRRLSLGANTLLLENPNLFKPVAALAGPTLRVECFPIGVDGSLFHPGYREQAEGWRFVLDIPAEAAVLLSPRGWSEVYGQHHIIKAFALACQRVDRPLVLALLGMGRTRNAEPYARDVLALGQALGVAHAIRWIPQIPFQDMPAVYSLADIVINYPSTDAFPSTLLEAAACARPVITSALPAYRNSFIESCFSLVDPESPEALADAIVEMIGPGSTGWRAQAETARATVLAEYDEKVQKERLLALYRQVAKVCRAGIG